MREPTVWQPTDQKIIEAAVDRFFERTPQVGAPCQMIAPVCAGCGREIDKAPTGWFHVAQRGPSLRKTSTQASADGGTS